MAEYWVWVHLDRLKCHQTDEYGDDEIFINLAPFGGDDMTVWGPTDMNEDTTNKSNRYIGKDVKLVDRSGGFTDKATIRVWENDPEGDEDKFDEFDTTRPPDPPATPPLQKRTIEHGDANYELWYWSMWKLE